MGHRGTDRPLPVSAERRSEVHDRSGFGGGVRGFTEVVVVVGNGEKIFAVFGDGGGEKAQMGNR